MKYRVYNKDNEFLGMINGKNPLDAMKEAKLFDMDTADRVEECVPEAKKGNGLIKHIPNLVITRARRNLMN